MTVRSASDPRGGSDGAMKGDAIEEAFVCSYFYIKAHYRKIRKG